MLKAGDKAPDFEAEAHTGEKVRLSDLLKSGTVILYFYPRAMTSGCTREASRFNELLDEFKLLNATVIGVSTDPPERNRRFAEKLGLKFLLLSDPSGEIARLYGVLKEGSKRVTAQRVTFIIGRDGKVLQVIRTRPAERHADESLSILKRLLQKL